MPRLYAIPPGGTRGFQDLRVKSQIATVLATATDSGAEDGRSRVTEAQLTDLVEAGLLHDGVEPRLTVKGRDWLRVLEDTLTQEIALTSQSDEDFVQSTNGLFR